MQPMRRCGRTDRDRQVEHGKQPQQPMQRCGAAVCTRLVERRTRLEGGSVAHMPPCVAPFARGTAAGRAQAACGRPSRWRAARKRRRARASEYAIAAEGSSPPTASSTAPLARLRSAGRQPAWRGWAGQPGQRGHACRCCSAGRRRACICSRMQERAAAPGLHRARPRPAAEGRPEAAAGALAGCTPPPDAQAHWQGPRPGPGRVRAGWTAAAPGRRPGPAGRCAGAAAGGGWQEARAGWRSGRCRAAAGHGSTHALILPRPLDLQTGAATPGHPP